MRSTLLATALVFPLAVSSCSPPPRSCDGACDGGADATVDGAVDATVDLPPPPAATCAPCATAADCAGTKPACLTKGMDGTVWPGGYCTSTCNPQKNDQQTGLNPGCPGGAATCAGNGTMGVCLCACTGHAGNMPCARDGYSCFVAGTTLGCEPTSLSQCDPTVKGSCPQDGGSFDNMGVYSGRVCVPVGDDPVGACFDGCDPFRQNCPTAMGQAQGCYATFQFGDGECAVPFGGGGDGKPCQYLNGCDPGFACHPEGNAAACRPYCGGPKMVACTNGKACVDLSSTTKSTVVGVCGG